MKNIFLAIFTFLVSVSGFSQIYDPVDWSFTVEQNGNGTFLVSTATIEEGWHVYSQVLESDDGPVATEFNFKPNSNYEKVGKNLESKTYKEYDPNFEMELSFFKDKAVLKQKINTKTDKAFSVKGSVYFMVCNESMCLPPSEQEFEFKVTPTGKNEIKIIPAEIENVKEEVKTTENTLPTDIGKPESQSNMLPNMENAEKTTSEEPKSGMFDPVDWVFSSKKTGENEYEISAKAKIEEHWHLYSSKLESEDGPVATEFLVKKSDNLELIGGIEERGKKINEFDPNFEMNLDYYANNVEFVQKIKVKDASKPALGEVYFMVCDESKCLPPSAVEFKIDLKTGKQIIENSIVENQDIVSTILPKMEEFDLNNPINDCGGESSSDEKKSLWVIFLLGLGAGLFSILTPCVYPMIPLTVSFFTKGGTDQKSGLWKAALYGFFIFLIYFLLSVPFHLTDADPQMLNGIATNPILNLIFFAVFVFFAFSFLGYYELTLPSKWSNKVDSASNVGGVIGIALMALTLALVSFSCTGPILGSVLAGVLKDGAWPLSAAMSGFGIALGLPFAIFAAFPSLMKSLPQSGGWLNTVKVVLGFLELALALKFLSNADLVMQWGLLKREVFFAIWILLGLGLAAYLMGWIRFPHDSKMKKLSLPRIGFIALILAFVIYLIPGVTCGENANRKLVSGFPPPMHYSYCGGEMFHVYKDYEEGKKAAQEQGKPMLVDFTGWACVNCREVEENIWPDKEVEKLIREKYILVSLYVDEKAELPKAEQGVVEIKYDNGKIKKKKIKTIGDKWFTFETLVFKNNAQPRYILLSSDGKLLNNPISYKDIKSGGGAPYYAEFLKCGLDAYEKIK